jgi:hypothetical protein
MKTKRQSGKDGSDKPAVTQQQKLLNGNRTKHGANGSEAPGRNIDLEDALNWLKCAGGQATALSLMNAELIGNVIRNGENAMAGRFIIPQAEHAEPPVAALGVHDLAFGAAIEFEHALDGYRRAVRAQERSPVVVDAARQVLQSAVDALAYLVRLQGRVIVDFNMLGDCDGRGEAVACAERTASLLREKFNDCRRLDGCKGEEAA